MKYVKIPKRYDYDDRGVPEYWDWCYKTFGPPNNSSSNRAPTEFYWGESGIETMYFADPEHAMLFALRWL